MSYLLDDKKILLKDLISKNENLKNENEHIKLENETFLRLIKKYETKKKEINIIQCLHYICTNLYKHEYDINFDHHYKQFLNELNYFLDTYIKRCKESFKSVVSKVKEEKETKGNSPKESDIEIVVDEEKEEKEEKEEEEKNNHEHSIYQNELILKNNLYDIDINNIVLHKISKNNTKMIELGTQKSKDGIEKNENEKIADECLTNLNETVAKDDAIDEKKLEKIGSINSEKEKKICIHWNKEEPNDDFIMTHIIKENKKTNNVSLNMKEKQQLVLNEIEKLKNEIKGISLYFENIQIIINSIISQSKIFLFELEEERKIYEMEKDRIQNDKYLIKKSNIINDFYNDIIVKQKKKIEDVKKTNETLINLYKKKFENMNYLISLNENINNEDFLYLNVLIFNKKLNYDKLMKEYERNYANLRKLLNEISNLDRSIKESEQKEKEIKSTIEKNNNMLSEMDELIMTITNEIEAAKNSSNKISEEETSNILNNHSILDCIQMNKDISAIESKIKLYQRKIQTLRNVKSKK